MHTVFVIVWRNPQTGNTVFVGSTEYATWKAADDALRTLWRQQNSQLTATIEERKVI
jgi:hypothetical protein